MPSFQLLVKNLPFALHCICIFSFFTITESEFIPVQVHVDHLCCPESHLCNWPMPPPNAILAPPFFTPCQVAKLVSYRTLGREHLGPRTTSDDDETEGEKSCSGEPKKVKKFVKRRANEPAETSDDEDQQSPQQRRQRRRRTALGQVNPPLTTCDSDDEVAISEEICISSEWKTFNRSEKTTPSEHDYWCHVHQACIICGILASWMPGTFFPPGTFRHFKALLGTLGAF